jgi:GLPGLI family protein
MKQTKRMTIVVACCLQAVMLHAQVLINIVRTDDVTRQEPVDAVSFTAQYEMTFISDTSQRDRTQVETMMLKVGEKSAVFYSYARYMTDSVVAADNAAGLPVEQIVEHVRAYQSNVTYRIYKNLPAGKVTTLELLAMDRFRCEERHDPPQWTLLNDTATILSYPCRKAICHFRGRDYEAWFTPDIPRSEGPWKLHGLPGLILRARDAKAEYIFECTALIRGKENESILYGASGYEPVSRKDLNRLFERFAADPIGYVTSSAPNVKVTIRDETGGAMRPKNTPYNPIELEE